MSHAITRRITSSWPAKECDNAPYTRPQLIASQSKKQTSDRCEPSMKTKAPNEAAQAPSSTLALTPTMLNKPVLAVGCLSHCQGAASACSLPSAIAGKSTPSKIGPSLASCRSSNNVKKAEGLLKNMRPCADCGEHKPSSKAHRTHQTSWWWEPSRCRADLTRSAALRHRCTCMPLRGCAAMVWKKRKGLRSGLCSSCFSWSAFASCWSPRA